MKRSALKQSGIICTFNGEPITGVPHMYLMQYIRDALAANNIGSDSHVLCLGNPLGGMPTGLRHQMEINAIGAHPIFGTLRRDPVQTQRTIMKGLDAAIQKTNKVMTQLMYAYIWHHSRGSFDDFLSSSEGEMAEWQHFDEPPPWMLDHYQVISSNTVRALETWHESVQLSMQYIMHHPDFYIAKTLQALMLDSENCGRFDAIVATGDVPSDPIQLHDFTNNALAAVRVDGTVIAMPLTESGGAQMVEIARQSGYDVSAERDGWHGLHGQDLNPLMLTKKQNPARKKHSKAA